MKSRSLVTAILSYFYASDTILILRFLVQVSPPTQSFTFLTGGIFSEVLAERTRITIKDIVYI